MNSTTIIEIYIKISYRFEHQFSDLNLNLDKHLNGLKSVFAKVYHINYGYFYTPFGALTILKRKRNITIDSNFVYETIYVKINNDKIKQFLESLTTEYLVKISTNYVSIPDIGFLTVNEIVIYNNSYSSSFDIKEPDVE